MIPQMADDSRLSLVTAASEEVPTTLSNISRLSCATAAADDNSRRWCNFMFTTRCPFCTPQKDAAAETFEPCKFMHFDAFVRMSPEERRATCMPNLMTRHMKGLVKEMTKIIENKARRVLDSFLVVRAWGGAADERVDELSPYQDTVDKLREIGWVLPALTDSMRAAFAEKTKLECAPWAADVVAILQLAGSCLHYDIYGCPPQVLKTIEWVFSLEVPTIRTRNPEVVPSNVRVVDAVVSDVESYSSLPPLLEEVSEASSIGVYTEQISPSSASGYTAPSSIPSDSPRNSRSGKKSKQRMAKKLRAAQQQMQAPPVQLAPNPVTARAAKQQQQQQQQQAAQPQVYGTVLPTQQQLLLAQLQYNAALLGSLM